MRSVFLSLVLGLGALGLSLASPSQARAMDLNTAAYMSSYTPVAQFWYGRSHWRGYSHYRYPGVGYGGYNRGYYPYGGYGYYGGGYGGYRSNYYPGYGGYSPFRYQYRMGPYTGLYGPGFYW